MWLRPGERGLGLQLRCGVRLDGTVACWGDNSVGEADPPAGVSSQVSAGRDYTCGVRPPGTLECWGGARIPAFPACGGDSDGDGIPDDGDGSGVAGDAACTEGNTSSCDDNCPATPNPDQADGDGVGVGNACDVAFNCTSTPRTGCLSPGKSVLRIQDKSPAGASAKDVLEWTWARGPALTQADFGDPTTTASYALCIYTGTALALEVDVAAGASWSAIGTTGYKFDDPTLAQDGTRSIKEKAGAAGKSMLRHKGKGTNLPLTPSPLPLDTSGGVRVQVHNSDSGTCWEASFSGAAVRKNTAELFEAKIP